MTLTDLAVIWNSPFNMTANVDCEFECFIHNYLLSYLFKRIVVFENLKQLFLE